MVDKKQIIEKIQEIRKDSPKRNFSQTFDLIINLKEYDIKKIVKVEENAVLPSGRGKKFSFAAFVDKDMVTASEETCKLTIPSDKLDTYTKEPKKIKKMAREYDCFIAEATVMPKIAAAFGRYLAPLGKMPNPKKGQVFAPKSDLKALTEKLSKQITILIQKQPVIKVPVGSEAQKDEEVADNIMHIYETIMKILPRGRHQIKSMLLKLTMSKPVRVEVS